MKPDSGWSWYQRHHKISKKILIAQRKFDSEVDLKNIITQLRLTKFLSKLQTSKRQRRSIDYSRKYTIEDGDIATERRLEEKEEQEKAKSLEQRRDEKEAELEKEKDEVI